MTLLLAQLSTDLSLLLAPALSVAVAVLPSECRCVVVGAMGGMVVAGRWVFGVIRYFDGH